jgi:hypothetical protein
MRKREQWKDGPGKMEFGDTVELTGINRASSAPGISKEHTHVGFKVFGSIVEVWWNFQDDEFSWRNQRHLSDRQTRYLKFLTMLISYTTFKDLRPEL